MESGESTKPLKYVCSLLLGWHRPRLFHNKRPQVFRSCPRVARLVAGSHTVLECREPGLEEKSVVAGWIAAQQPNVDRGNAN